MALSSIVTRTSNEYPRRLFAPGRPDIVRNIDDLLAVYFSMSYAAPHLFGNMRAEFEVDVRAELMRHSPSGLFWDWPGDTEILLVGKPKGMYDAAR